jgi:hypothetical protein
VYKAPHTSYPQATPNVYTADLSSFGLTSVAGLRANGARMIRARYPNANPEGGFGSNLLATSWVPTNVPIQPAIQYEPATPYRNISYSFNQYQAGYGGICGVPGFGFEPAVSHGRLKPSSTLQSRPLPLPLPYNHHGDNRVVTGAVTVLKEEVLSLGACPSA